MNDLTEKSQNTWEAGKDALKSTGADNIKDKWQETVEEAKHTLESGAKQAKEALHTTTECAKDASVYLAETISKNPWKSVVVVAIASWFIAKISKK